MALKARAKSHEARELIPAKRYKAMVIGVCDIGTQQFDNGAEHQIAVIWELHSKKGPALNSKGEIFTVSRFYSLKFGEYKGKKAKLRADVEAMYGRSFTDKEAEEGIDVEQLLDLCCELQIAHVPSKKDKEKKWAEISALMSIDPEDDKPEMVSDSFYYEIDTSKPIDSSVPKWLHKQIEKSLEWIKVHGQPKDANLKGSNPLSGSQSSQFDETDGDEDEDEDDDSPDKPPF